MSLTREESALLDQRESLTQAEQNVVADSMDTLFGNGKLYNVPLLNDDRLCRVEAAMIRLVLESRK